MMIRIRYPDGRYDMVKASQLDRLIESGRIRAFKRQEGWAVPGRDPIRGQGGGDAYLGRDRRNRDLRDRPLPGTGRRRTG